MTEGQPETAGPLSGVVVLDLTRALAGPHAAMMLADMGARVIKVESPEGDDSRRWGPPYVGGESTYFMSCNRNKESIALDFKDAEDKSVMERLVRRADVILENFRPGVLDRLGLGHDQLLRLNPRAVVLTITGFGHDGPEAGRPGYDQIAQGEGGLMSITGDAEPTKVGVPIADLLAGMNGAYGVLAALYERQRTGRGRIVRTSLLAGVVGVHAFQGTRWTVGGDLPGLSGNHHPSIAPYGTFKAVDGVIQVACGNERLWRLFAEVIGVDSKDPRFATNAERTRHLAELTEIVESRLAVDTSAAWLAKIASVGVPCGRVRTIDEVYSWDQTVSQGLVIEVDHPTAGRVKLPGPVLRLDDNSYAGGRAHHSAPPLLDEHRADVMRWLDEDSGSL